MTEPNTRSHACVGLSCWTCGEPDVLRDMRQKRMLPALADAPADADHHALARIAAESIREDVQRLWFDRYDAADDRDIALAAIRKALELYATHYKRHHPSTIHDPACDVCRMGIPLSRALPRKSDDREAIQARMDRLRADRAGGGETGD